MNFSQLHERLRLELLGRIEREVITASLLARKSGLQPPHISNFLRNKRRLSLPALDRVLAALGLSAAELLPAPQRSMPLLSPGVPIVSQQTAMFDDVLRPTSILGRVALPPGGPPLLQAEASSRPSARERFVAVSLTVAQALPMEPRLHPNALVILDRHATNPSTLAAATLLPSMYAVRLRGELHFCYLTFERNTFILRPHSLTFPIQLLPVPPGTTPAELVTGRVCLSIAYF